MRDIEIDLALYLKLGSNGILNINHAESLQLCNCMEQDNN